MAVCVWSAAPLFYFWVDQSGGKKKGSEADSSEVLAKPGKWLEAVRERAPPTYWRIYKGNLLLHAHLNRFQILEHAKVIRGRNTNTHSARTNTSFVRK